MKKVCSLLVALVAFVPGLFAAVPPSEKLLPDDTLVVFCVPDVSRLLTTYNNSPQTQLWNDPAMRPFKDKFVNKLKAEFITPLERDLGVHFDDYTSLPQGQLTLAVTRDQFEGKDNDPHDPGVILIVDTREKSSQLKSNLADLKKKWIDAGKTVKTEKIRDIEFSGIAISSNDLPKSLQKLGKTGDTTADTKTDDKSAPKSLIYLGQSDSVFIMANSTKLIERVLSAMSGGSAKTLIDVPAYSANHNAMFRDVPIYWWVNVKGFFDLVKNSSEFTQSSGGPSGDQIFAALGLYGLKTAAMNYVFSDEGAQVNVLLGAPEAARGGLLKILAGEPKDCNPPPFVPADAVKYQRYRLDFQKVWNGIRQIVGNLSAESLGQMDQGLSAAETAARQKDPNFDFKKNFIGNLGDDFIVYSKSPKGTSLKDLNSQPTLYLLGSPNPEQLIDSVKSLMALLGGFLPAPTEREFRGHKIYSINIPTMSVDDSDSKAPQPAFSFSSGGGYIAMGMDTAILEEYLRSSENQGKSLRETAGLSGATQRVARDGTSLFGYSNDGETMRTLFAALKKDNGASALGSFEPVLMAMGLEDISFKEWIDVSLLPSYDRVSKYFSFSVYAAGATPEGLFFKAFAPVPPGLHK